MRIVPISTTLPTPAAIISVLAEAMNFTGPIRRSRLFAGDHPVSEEEGRDLLRAYTMIRAAPVRQAILDVLVAAGDAQG